VKKLLLSLVFVFALVLLAAPQSFAQGCAVTGISLTSTGTSSSTCFVPAGQGIAYAITGTWVGTTNVYRSDNGGVSYSSILTTTATTSGIYPPTTSNALFKVTFDSRTSGTVTGTLLGLNPLPGLRIYSSVPSLIGPVAYGSLGTSTQVVQYTDYITSVVIPRAMTVTSIDALWAATVGTDKCVFALYDGSGALLGSSAVAGTTSANANAFQDLAMVSNISVAAGLYYIGITCDTGTDTLRLTAASTVVDQMTTSATGSAVTPPTVITVPTTFTATKGPIAYVKGF
jgi:hypothetical protein